MTPAPIASRYTLVYDASRVWFPAWPIAAAGLVALALGTVLLLVARRRVAHVAYATLAERAGTTLVILGAGWAVVMGLGLYNEHARLRHALERDDYTIVEGTVVDRPPMSDRSEPAWIVASGPRDRPTAHWYRYAHGWTAPGYQRIAPGTGAMHDGSTVRIADVDGQIARLEVWR